jgi:hypothetical protein
MLLIGSSNADQAEGIGLAGKVNSGQCIAEILSAYRSLSFALRFSLLVFSFSLYDKIIDLTFPLFKLK